MKTARNLLIALAALWLANDYLDIRAHFMFLRDNVDRIGEATCRALRDGRLNDWGSDPSLAHIYRPHAFDPTFADLFPGSGRADSVAECSHYVMRGDATCRAWEDFFYEDRTRVTKRADGWEVHEVIGEYRYPQPNLFRNLLFGYFTFGDHYSLVIESSTAGVITVFEPYLPVGFAKRWGRLEFLNYQDLKDGLPPCPAAQRLKEIRDQRRLQKGRDDVD